MAYTNTLAGMLLLNDKNMADIYPTNVLDDAPVVRAMFAQPASKGGTYLLNVGPMADGSLPPDAMASIRTVGQWYGKVKEALTAEPASDLLQRDDFMLTRRGNHLYIHFHNDPDSGGIHLNPLATMPKLATVLNTGHPLSSAIERVPTLSIPPRMHTPCLHLRGIPVNDLVGEIIILKLEFEELDQALQTAATRPAIAEYRY